jgi:hypothetical protein
MINYSTALKWLKIVSVSPESANVSTVPQADTNITWSFMAQQEKYFHCIVSELYRKYQHYGAKRGWSLKERFDELS